MSREIVCNACGERIDESAEGAAEWWEVAAWKRSTRFAPILSGVAPMTPDNTVNKDLCPRCMPLVQGTMSSAGRRP